MLQREAKLNDEVFSFLGTISFRESENVLKFAAINFSKKFYYSREFVFTNLEES